MESVLTVSSGDARATTLLDTLQVIKRDGGMLEHHIQRVGLCSTLRVLLKSPSAPHSYLGTLSLLHDMEGATRVEVMDFIIFIFEMSFWMAHGLGIRDLVKTRVDH